MCYKGRLSLQISGKIEVEHVISKKLQLKRKAEVCELGAYSGDTQGDFFLQKMSRLLAQTLYPLFFSSLRMIWCVNSTARSMTSWTVSLRSRPAWSLRRYQQSSHLWCPTKRKINSGAAIKQASDVWGVSAFVHRIHLLFNFILFFFF